MTCEKSNHAGYNVIETLWILKFPQVQGSLQFARKVALDQVAYENEARGLNGIETISVFFFFVYNNFAYIMHGYTNSKMLTQVWTQCYNCTYTYM